MRRARALRRIRYNGATFLSFSAMNSRFAAIIAPLRDLLRYRDRPELFALLIYQAITTTGFTLLMPLVSVHFVADVGMAAATVAPANQSAGANLHWRHACRPLRLETRALYRLDYSCGRLFHAGLCNGDADVFHRIIAHGFGRRVV